MPVPVLHTARLILRAYVPTDRVWFVQTFSDPVVMKHVGGTLTTERASALFDGICAPAPPARIYAAWCVEREEEIVGHGALLRKAEDLELAYILSPSAWGRGYATEIARALRDYTFGPVGRTRLMATVDEDHPPSSRVLDKIGMTLLERVEDAEGPYLRYSLSNTAS